MSTIDITPPKPGPVIETEIPTVSIDAVINGAPPISLVSTEVVNRIEAVVTVGGGGGGKGLPDGILPPPEPGTLATVEAINAGNISIPFSAIQSPLGPTFRGEWRGYGEVVYYNDFMDGIPEGLVTNTVGATVSPPGLKSIVITPASRRPNLPGAQVAFAGSTAWLEIHLSEIPLPTDIEIVRVEFFAYITGYNSAGYPTKDGLDVANVLPGNDTEWAPRCVFAAGIKRNSIVGIRAVPWYYGSDIGITGITVYGTNESDYRLNDTVTYRGRLWQSLANNNSDEPGLSSRWLDIGLMSGAIEGIPLQPVSANTTIPTYDNKAIQNIIDGSLSTYWHGSSGPAIGSWIGVDLGSVREVTRVVVYMGGTSTASFFPTGNLELSVDGADWVGTSWETFSENHSGLEFAWFGKIEARYIRYVATVASGNWAQCREFEVWGIPD